jgi:hypothetical protein
VLGVGRAGEILGPTSLSRLFRGSKRLGDIDLGPGSVCDPPAPIADHYLICQVLHISDRCSAACGAPRKRQRSADCSASVHR